MKLKNKKTITREVASLIRRKRKILKVIKFNLKLMDDIDESIRKIEKGYYIIIK